MLIWEGGGYKNGSFIVWFGMKLKSWWQADRFGDKNANAIAELKLPGLVVDSAHLETVEALESSGE